MNDNGARCSVCTLYKSPILVVLRRELCVFFNWIQFPWKTFCQLCSTGKIKSNNGIWEKKKVWNTTKGSRAKMLISFIEFPFDTDPRTNIFFFYGWITLIRHGDVVENRKKKNRHSDICGSIDNVPCILGWNIIRCFSFCSFFVRLFRLFRYSFIISKPFDQLLFHKF